MIHYKIFTDRELSRAIANLERHVRDGTTQVIEATALLSQDRELLQAANLELQRRKDADKAKPKLKPRKVKAK